MTESSPDHLTGWLQQTRQAGRTDSAGMFTLDPREAWGKLGDSLLKADSQAYLVQLIQASVKANLRTFWGQRWTYFRPAEDLQLEDLPGRLHVGGRISLTHPSALASALEQDAPPLDPLLKHLWMAVLASCSHPDITSIEFTTWDGRQEERLEIQTDRSPERLQLHGSRRPSGVEPGWSWDFRTLEKPRGLRRFLSSLTAMRHSGLSPDFEELQQSFAVAPIEWQNHYTDTTAGVFGLLGSRSAAPPGSSHWDTLAESYELAEPGDEEGFSVSWRMAQRTFRLEGLGKPDWHSSWDSLFSPARPWRSVYCDLASSCGQEKTLAFACGESFLCRQAAFLPLASLELPQSPTEDGTLIVVQDGAILNYYGLDLPYPGAVVVVAAQGLRTDLNTRKVVQDQAWERCYQEARRHTRDLVSRAAQALAELRRHETTAYEEVRSLVRKRQQASTGRTRCHWMATEAELFPE